MINYLSRFAPRLAEINEPLRQMLKQGNEFTWDETHNVAFQQIKDLITREPGPVLAYYNPNEELRLQVDASKNGLGAVLLQQEKPIAYASKSLTETEQNYAQIVCRSVWVQAISPVCIWEGIHCGIGPQTIRVHIKETAFCRPSTPTAHVSTAAEVLLHVAPQTR